MVILSPEPRKCELLDDRILILEPTQRQGSWASDHWQLLDLKKEKECGRREGAWILPKDIFFFKSCRVSAIMALFLPISAGRQVQRVLKSSFSYRCGPRSIPEACASCHAGLNLEHFQENSNGSRSDMGT